MKGVVTIAFLLSLSVTTFAQYFDFDYFGLSSPGDSIKLFAPNIVSLKNVKEKSLAISPTGDEVFFSGGKSWPESKIIQVKKINNRWGEPQVADFCMDCFACEPAFSPDGKYLFFSSSKGETDIKQYCIWRMERVGAQWGHPQKIINITDPNIWEFHPTVAKNGSISFCCWDAKTQFGSIYKSEYTDGSYADPVKISLSFDIKSSVTDPFVDPDEKYIITSSTDQNGKGGYDVFISYKKEDNSWSLPVSPGNRFNTSGDEDSFDVSPDGKFVFIYKQDDIYWTEAKGVIEKSSEH
ncbi:MAG: hypothetical protein PHP53_11110 [Prolixibacteraceae bacterium]|nr:hypothetical protein [Prolixibacteraceae bacterium]